LRKSYNILVGKTYKKLGIRNDNMKMDLKGTECEGVDWIKVGQDKVHCDVL
jgi:hypothetical protein